MEVAGGVGTTMMSAMVLFAVVLVASVTVSVTWVVPPALGVPLITPVVLFNLIIGVIGTMQIFNEAFVMTQGGPADSTLFYAYHLFRQAFQYFRMGYASAMAWILFLVILLVTVVQFRLARRWVHYSGDES